MEAVCVIRSSSCHYSDVFARGFSQVHTVDFFETYAPTPAASSVNYLKAVAVENDWELR